MTAEGCLAADGFNAVIVGDGAIGTALLANLLQRPGCTRVLFLGRGERPAARDSRVSRLFIDAEAEDSILAAARASAGLVDRVHLLINTVGMLHGEGQQPEKRLKELDPAALRRSFTINAALLPLLAQAYGPLLRHHEAAVMASLSARVGSIGDNRLGGWYSYRASKAAHNMLLKTIAREWRVSHRNVALVALHPGTVRSRLSEPFISAGYRKRVLTPAECADSLLAVVGGLGPQHSGEFFDWQGQQIPW